MDADARIPREVPSACDHLAWLEQKNRTRKSKLKTHCSPKAFSQPTYTFGSSLFTIGGSPVPNVAIASFSVFETVWAQTGLTFSALGPLGPRPSVYVTRCPSCSSS